MAWRRLHRCRQPARPRRPLAAHKAARIRKNSCATWIRSYGPFCARSRQRRRQPPPRSGSGASTRTRALARTCLPGSWHAQFQGLLADQRCAFSLSAVPIAGDLRPALLYTHGGGYISGNTASSWPKFSGLQKIAQDHDCLIVSVDYRLAPETAFPGALEDSYAALKWLHANANSLGADPKRIAIMGESAGGGLAATLAIAARDRGEVPVMFQLLIYPMLDDRTGSTREPAPHIGQIYMEPSIQPVWLELPAWDARRITKCPARLRPCPCRRPSWSAANLYRGRLG